MSFVTILVSGDRRNGVYLFPSNMTISRREEMEQRDECVSDIFLIHSENNNQEQILGEETSIRGCYLGQLRSFCTLSTFCRQKYFY